MVRPVGFDPTFSALQAGTITRFVKDAYNLDSEHCRMESNHLDLF